MKFLLRMMLAAALVNIGPALAKAPKDPVASPAVLKEFDGFIEKISRGAEAANDSAAIAAADKIAVHERQWSIRDAAQFRAKTYAGTLVRREKSRVSPARQGPATSERRTR